MQVAAPDTFTAAISYRRRGTSLPAGFRPLGALRTQQRAPCADMPAPPGALASAGLGRRITAFIFLAYAIFAAAARRISRPRLPRREGSAITFSCPYRKWRRPLYVIRKFVAPLFYRCRLRFSARRPQPLGFKCATDHLIRSTYRLAE